MTDKSIANVQSNPSVDAVSARRKMLRAGLAAAPVLMGLKTQSAMATGTVNHCKPSVWSSLKGANGCRSSHTIQSAGKTCSHYTDWAVSNHTECSKKFHYNQYSACVPFGGSHWGDYSTIKDVCGGKKRDAYNYTSNFTTGDSERDTLSKHCASMYMNNVAYGSAPVDIPTCKSIWNACKDNGVWSPPHGGTAWTRKDCNEYFEYCSKGTQPASWNNTCA